MEFPAMPVELYPEVGVSIPERKGGLRDTP